MDKTLNINLGGTLFSIDTKAYDALHDYLQAIGDQLEGTNGGNETIEDIERRIAEIFNSCKSPGEAITIEDVQSMISIIGAPADFEQNDDRTRPTATGKRLYRDPANTVIAGVCSGIGAYLNIDPVLIRIIFVLFTMFFGSGIFIYIVMWISIQPANSCEQRRKMTGVNSYNYKTTRLGNAINEIFKVIKNIIYVIARTILIIIGVALVIAGFATLLSLLFVFLIKIPAASLPLNIEIPMATLTDLIKTAVTPASYPWILILTSAVILLPLLAVIYWGIKMIFWFKAKDGILSLVLFITWIVSAVALGFITASEGISFAQQSVAYKNEQLYSTADTVYITVKNTVSLVPAADMKAFKADKYYMLIDSKNNELHISPNITVKKAGDSQENISIAMSAHGSNGINAFDRANKIDYNCNVSGDTIYIDDYFTIPQGNKWMGETVKVSINLAEGKVVKIDETTDRLLNFSAWRIGNTRHIDRPILIDGHYTYWVVSSNGHLVPYSAANHIP
ncbi:MAG: PspC domain-containing protein [Bacteroidales bacterium]|jgi:phage shock protein PspC (stress-responsive transcriptional regulator)|nr:PspC domain-containing protein [Bacteroidales bacterium]